MSQTVGRAVAILELIAEKPRSLSEVARHLDVHRSTALRLLQTLDAAKFARRGEDGLWAVGVGIIAIAQRTLDSLDIREVAKPHLRRLGERCHHTIHLGQLIGNDVVYIDKVEGRGNVRMYSRVGLTASMHASGVAKAIVAFLEEPRRSDVIQRIEFRRYTSTTVTPLSNFHRELEAIAERGWSTDDGEFEELINCVAAPVRGGDGRVRAAVSIAAPKVLAPLQELEQLVPDLLRATGDISGDLGWSGIYSEISERRAP